MDVKKEQNLLFEIYRERVFLREDSSKGESFFLPDFFNQHFELVFLPDFFNQHFELVFL